MTESTAAPGEDPKDNESVQRPERDRADADTSPETERRGGDTNVVVNGGDGDGGKK